MADILIAAEAAPSTPASGNALIYVDSTSKLLSIKDDGGIVKPNPFYIRNQSVANQTGVTGFDADSYIVGSSIALPIGSGIRVGARYRLQFDMTKSAACTSTPILTLRIGTLGTTADAAICQATFGAGTAAADTGLFTVDAVFRTVGASTAAVVQGTFTLTNNLATTGLSNAVKAVLVTSSGFDSTVAGLIIGVSFNGGTTGANFVGNSQFVDAEYTQL